MNDLIVVEKVDAIQVFSEKGLDPILDKITKGAKSIVADVSTVKGRKEIASIAYKVAQSKTVLDNAGKDLVSGWKEKAKVVDAERKRMRDYLDALKDEVREPLTKWEEEEKERERKIQARIDEIQLAGAERDDDGNYFDSTTLKDKLAWLKGVAVDESFGDKAPFAAQVKDRTVTLLENIIAKREQEEEQAREIARLKAEQQERERLDREERLRKEGEERARREAEEKARQERERVEQERIDEEKRQQAERQRIEEEKIAAIRAKEEAERRAKEAEERAKREAEEAVEAERARAERQRLAEIEAEKKREQDKKHRAAINNAAASVISSIGVDVEVAKAIVVSIAKGQVPHVSIKY